FSSRRRHTRFSRDWSSDVCSSDLLCAAQFMLILDLAIVNVALPSMQRTLGLSAENIQWVVGGYALTFGGFLMLGGRLADVVGRRRMFLTGLVLFIGASMLGGLSQSGGMLIAARVIQGFEIGRAHV